MFKRGYKMFISKKKYDELKEDNILLKQDVRALQNYIKENLHEDKQENLEESLKKYKIAILVDSKNNTYLYEYGEETKGVKKLQFETRENIIPQLIIKK